MAKSVTVTMNGKEYTFNSRSEAIKGVAMEGTFTRPEIAKITGANPAFVHTLLKKAGIEVPAAKKGKKAGSTSAKSAKSVAGKPVVKAKKKAKKKVPVCPAGTYTTMYGNTCEYESGETAYDIDMAEEIPVEMVDFSSPVTEDEEVDTLG